MPYTNGLARTRDDQCRPAGLLSGPDLRRCYQALPDNSNLD
jgi:hypothetical protein